MTNTLAPNENILSPTLPVKDQYGRFDVGGPIGPGDIKNALAGDQQVQFGANMLLDVTPGIESVRSAERLPEQWQAYQNAESPIQQVLRAAEMALEGGALVADVIPHVKALGIGGAALIGLMARRTDEIEGMARFGLARRQQGLIGYHGSPHKFDKFDHSQMGSGEGAQAYGWGTYIAEDPAVAGTYKGMGRAHDWDPVDGYSALEDQLSRRMMKMQDAGRYDEAGAIEELLINRDTDRARARFADSPAALSEIKRYEGQFIPSNLYTVDLPDSKIAQMLDWDAPLSEQPESVRNGVKQILSTLDEDDMGYGLTHYLGGRQADVTDEMMTNFDDWSGQQVQRVLEYAYDERGAAEALRSKGIPGIKYFDGNSRTAGQGTRNFVVFDENDMTILSRNGEAVNTETGLSLFHGTDEVFDQFDEDYISDFGFHLGSADQASQFGKHQLPIDASIKNPLRLDDLGTWDYQSVIRDARKKGVDISEAEYDYVFNQFDGDKATRRLLESKGYDGIVYKNMVEGGEDSYIAFKPDQMKILK